MVVLSQAETGVVTGSAEEHDGSPEGEESSDDADGGGDNLSK